MKKERHFFVKIARWKQFDNKKYSAFRSVKKEVTIGVLAVATLTFANANSISAQTETPRQLKTYELDEVEVTGTRVPLSELQAAKPVTVITRADIQAAAVHSINDLLKSVTGIDVRQRGEFGIQTDISVRGGTFDQLTILLNGVNINNPQTGHLTADFPVSLNDIERIEILEGPAARVFGTSAFTGAINIVTKNDSKSHVEVHSFGGQHALLNGGGRLNYSKGYFSNQLSTDYTKSDGAVANSDFHTLKAYYQGTYQTESTNVQWQLGSSNQRYGANTFYSAAYPNQYEETQKYFASVKAVGQDFLHLSPTIYWNRTYDHFQLIRGTHTAENFHRTDVYGINLNAYINTVLGKTAFGAELRNEGILSTALGKPMDESQYVNVSGEKGIQYTKKDNRTQINYFLEHNVLLEKATFSFGIMAANNTTLDHKYRLYPGIDISYRPNRQWKLYASCNSALRMPTFTDLYYKSPTTEGNIGLKPEKTYALSIGAKYRNNWLNTDIGAFYHRGRNMIDWVMYNASDTYHSTNFKLDNMGIETSATVYFRNLLGENSYLDNLQIGYCYINQKRHDRTEIYKSNYALEYLRHKITAKLTHRIWRNLDACWSFRFQERMGSYIEYDTNHKSTGKLVAYSPFGIMDLKLQWTAPNYNVFAEAGNLFDRHYYDLGNVPQAGLWLRAGFSWRVNL
jgi:vitamin B12 transporter